jgi:hypothetical protein
LRHHPTIARVAALGLGVLGLSIVGDATVQADTDCSKSY